MLLQKPFAESCEQNKAPILSVLREVFVEPGTVLEIGGGTGQHAVYFSSEMAHLTWQPTEKVDQLAGIRAWMKEAGLSNIDPPLVLDVIQEKWPLENVDMAFSANTAHIMSWTEVKSMFNGLGKALKTGGVFCLYGPFNYNYDYTSASNARFDIWLKQRDPESGIRNFEDINEQADQAGLSFLRDVEMPANNRILVWRKN